MKVLDLRTMRVSEGLRPSDLDQKTGEIMETTATPTVYTNGQDFVVGLPENVILQTANHEIFRLDPSNRKISQDKLDRMYTAIEARNLLHLFPIVVSRDLTVIDGQHRLKVAQALGTPIYYIVSDQMRIEDASLINTNIDRWKAEDWLDHWCSRGMPEYLRLKEFWGRHKWLTLSAARYLCYTGDISGARDDVSHLSRRFSDGVYVANNIPAAEGICGMAKDFSTWVPFWKEKPFLSALRNLHSNTDYDHTRMMQKMQYLSSRLVKCATSDDYIAVISAIYNYKVGEKDRVVLTRIGSTGNKRRSKRLE